MPPTSGSCRDNERQLLQNEDKNEGVDEVPSTVTIKSLYPGRDVEKSACGVGFICHAKGKASNDLLLKSQVMSSRMEHRGACSCDNLTGDGAGVLTSIPHKLLSRKLSECNPPIVLPEPGSYATGLVFLDEATADQAQAFFAQSASRLRLKVLTWIRPPTDPSCLGSVALGSQPLIKQVFLLPDPTAENIQDEVSFSKTSVTFEEKIFFLR
jgi:glutamate synthase (NADPH/NADH)